MGTPADGPAAPPAILVVDDEPLVLREMVRGLARSGAKVLAAPGPAEARRILAEREEVAVLVTDVRMPGESGLSLAAHALSLAPEARAVEVVIISGHNTQEEAMEEIRTSAFEFIQKPFRLAELRAAVERAAARAWRRRGLKPAGGMAEDAAQAGDAQLSIEAWLGGRGAAAAAALVLLPFGGPLPEAEARAHLAAALEPGQEVGLRVWEVPPGRLAMGFDMLARPALEALLGRLAAQVPRIAGAHGSERPLEGLLVAAEAALQDASPGARFAFDRHGALLRGAMLGRDLMAPLAEERFLLRCQPVFHGASSRLAGFEAKLAWNHPALGRVEPAELAGLAAAFGQEARLAGLGLEAGVALLANWRETVPGELTLWLPAIAPGLTRPGGAAALAAQMRRLGLASSGLGLLFDALGPGLAEALAAGLGAALRLGAEGSQDLWRLPAGALLQARPGGLSAARRAGGAPGDCPLWACGIKTPAQLRDARGAGAHWLQGDLFAPPLDPFGAAEMIARQAESEVGLLDALLAQQT